MSKTARELLERQIQIIEQVDNRCMAADGDVTPTRLEMTDEEMRNIYRLGKQALADINKYEKQLKGYAELLGSANHDVEELTKYAADKEKECKQLKNTIVRILDMSAVRNRCECGRPTGLGAIHCCAEQVLEKDNVI